MMESHPLNDDTNNPYAYFASDQHTDYAMAGYTTYQSMHAGPRGPMVGDLQQPYQLNTMAMQQQYQSGVFSTSSPHGSLPLSNSPPPPSPDLYDPISPPLSGSDTSADGLYHHSNSSGANSPSSSRGHSLVHRTPRYNPTPSPTSASSRRRSHSQDSDDDDMGASYVENLAHSRKEATRRQRIEAEQRRRDELRDGYSKLKDVLPISNMKASKVSLLERATNHIIFLEKENKELAARIAMMEEETQRLRALNEKISLSTEGTPSPNATGRPLSPPPDTAPTSLVSGRGQHPPSERSEQSSPSASEGGH